MNAASLGKQGGRRYCQLGDTSAWRAYTSTGSGGAVPAPTQTARRFGALGDAMPATASLRARAWGTSAAPAPTAVLFRRTLSALGTRAGERQLHKGD